MNKRSWLQGIGLLGAVLVAAGAFGAHGLREQISADRLQTWNTGVRYGMWHVLGLLAVVLSEEDLISWRWVLR